jgi:TorA maturation chaperone TorD
MKENAMSASAPNTANHMASASHSLPSPAASEAADAEQIHRANAYQMLASLLRAAPSTSVLHALGNLGDATSSKDELGIAMALLGLAARNSQARRVDDEFHDLFIGLGRGELVPFGSWYQTGFLMEKPLGLLRDDLRKLGIERQTAVKEPEDHAAALCEALALLIAEATALERQRDFFQAHMAPWFERFFKDMQNARGAAFYKAVGRFGAAFTAFEQRYLSMPA